MKAHKQKKQKRNFLVLLIITIVTGLLGIPSCVKVPIIKSIDNLEVKNINLNTSRIDITCSIENSNSIGITTKKLDVAIFHKDNHIAQIKKNDLMNLPGKQTTSVTLSNEIQNLTFVKFIPKILTNKKLTFHTDGKFLVKFLFFDIPYRKKQNIVIDIRKEILQNIKKTFFRQIFRLKNIKIIKLVLQTVEFEITGEFLGNLGTNYTIEKLIANIRSRENSIKLGNLSISQPIEIKNGKGKLHKIRLKSNNFSFVRSLTNMLMRGKMDIRLEGKMYLKIADKNIEVDFDDWFDTNLEKP